MPGIRIRDLAEGTLAFDLADLLKLLGDSVRDSIWKCFVAECIPVDLARPDLAKAYNTQVPLTGRELLALAEETRQVIDGKFEAFHIGDDRPWITLKAVDSTYWEVFASDYQQFAPFQSRFQNVECIEEEAA